MNIAIFTDTYPPYINGVATSTYNLVNVLRAHGHRVLVITARYTDGPLEMIDDMIYMPGIQIKSFYGYRLTALYSRTILEYLEEFKVDVIHIQADWSVSQFGKIAAKRLKVPMVYTYHTQYEDYTVYVTSGFWDRVAKGLMRWYTKVGTKQTAGYITPSYKTKEYLRQINTDVHVSIIPTGIDFSLFDDDKYDAEKGKAFRKEHNIPENAKIFLLLGRVGKEKSMDVSMKCYAAFREKHPEIDCRLILVGGGPQLEELKVLSGELGIGDEVIFTGPVLGKETPFYYHLADIYTSASITETQGLTFMESMSSGTIVLARYDDQLNGTIIDGETGFFFTDTSSFIDKAERILSLTDKEKHVIKTNMKKVLEMYSIDKFYEGVIDVYTKAIKKFW